VSLSLLFLLYFPLPSGTSDGKQFFCLPMGHECEDRYHGKEGKPNPLYGTSIRDFVVAFLTSRVPKQNSEVVPVARGGCVWQHKQVPKPTFVIYFHENNRTLTAIYKNAIIHKKLNPICCRPSQPSISIIDECVKNIPRNCCCHR